ncbi:epidermal growth factor receptor kinase substrate 8-like protein 2 [Corchorus olitorius]|uniref:Epidermal growth factor receptor kinase substrate 8-like protein 2 n=1 Tax=Corchorus olitorius TaxID=93759 RepID=A0A1R3L469_9ROSI|nr:epidermal growth factor receptor kinase substrate 8-like protein 2 [Corchorus olitorius]
MTVPVYHEPRKPLSLLLISTWEPGCKCGGGGWSSVAGALFAFRLVAIAFLGG